ncbi:MAG: bifunctional riboflavin kinase/FAD synthetase [Rhodothermales bacterium]|nr:bifunctional riboflavin kinase/FAD synthetase [Rhodothermales bacterium]
MEYIVGLDSLAHDARSIVTVGTFDGVHLGHRSIIAYLVERAHLRRGISVAVSFHPHPRDVVRGTPTPLLTTIEERAEALDALGLDRFIVIPFTPELAGMDAAAFVTDVLLARIGLQEIVIGYDHGFGRGREGDSALLRELGEQYGFGVDVIPAQVLEADVVSSTRIRQVLVDEGDVRQAAGMLGRPYRLTGSVIRGDGRGRLIGYPTANLAVDNPRKVVPMPGVYAVRVWRPGVATPAAGMLNIGVRPTFNGADLRIEVHLLDVEADLYGHSLRVDFVERIRDEKKFTTVDALVEQLSKDKARCMAELER